MFSFVVEIAVTFLDSGRNIVIFILKYIFENVYNGEYEWYREDVKLLGPSHWVTESMES